MALTLKNLTLSKAWPDLLAFLLGLALAWFLKWETKDLIWSLWLSSFLVGYTTIVISIAKGIHAKSTLSLAITIFGAFFFLGFFTVHFGMFHIVHSVFLNGFFPVVFEPGGKPQREPSLSLYWVVLISYWPMVIATLISERRNVLFENKPNNFMAPYVNVVRMHLLIFFFAGVSALNIESFIIYAVVYVIYFFPWRLLSPENKHKKTANP